MNTIVSIRAVQREDDEPVRKLVTAILQREFREEERALLNSDLDSVSSNYQGQDEIFLVACDGPQIVGTVGIKREDQRRALLRRVFVEQQYRKKKIGFQLVQKAIDFCSDRGYEEIIFKTTSRMKDAIRLCQDLGFVRKATVPLGSLELFKFTLSLKKISPKK